MISMSFINNGYDEPSVSNPFFTVEKCMLEMNEDIDNSISSLIDKYNEYMTESYIMDSRDIEHEVYLESEGKNIFDKIGDAIIAIFKKIGDAIASVIKKITSIGNKTKDAEDKMTEIKKDKEKYNDIKDEVVIAFKDGELDSADLKTLREIDASYDELINMSKDKNVTPDQLQGKFNAMKKKFSNIDKSAVVKTVAAAGTVVTAATCIATFKGKVASSKSNVLAYQEKIKDHNEATVKAINQMKNFEFKGEKGSLASDNLSKARITKNANYWINGEYSKLVSKEESIIDKFSKAFDSFFNKYKPSGKTGFNDEVKLANDINKYKDSLKPKPNNK